MIDGPDTCHMSKPSTSLPPADSPQAALTPDQRRRYVAAGRAIDRELMLIGLSPSATGPLWDVLAELCATTPR